MSRENNEEEVDRTRFILQRYRDRLKVLRLGKEYSQKVADALIRDLDAIVQKLNSTYQQDLREESERFAFYNGKY